MFLYLLGLIILVAILVTAGYMIVVNIRKEIRNRSNEYRVLQDPDTVVDEMIGELIKIDSEHETEDSLEIKKKDILNTFIDLHRSGSFCAHLKEEEVIRFVKHKLYIGE